MANLISPGVSVTVTDESFFIPAGATTVPLFFIATADEKTQQDGTSRAAGTYESDVVRTVTTVSQSLELYGVPSFLEDASGNQHHGDARNEYGLFALNQFLGVGNRAYVVRANVNLNDDIDYIRDMWNRHVIDEGATTLQILAQELINQFNQANGYASSDPNAKETVTESELKSLIDEALMDTFDKQVFENAESAFKDDHSGSPLAIYDDGYDNPPSSTAEYLGIAGLTTDWVNNGDGSVVADEWTPTEASNFLQGAADDFKLTMQFRNATRLGANDAARRTAIVEALQASVNSNQEVRSEQYEYNLILCPGYPEVADELVALSVDIREEAMVVADTPMDKAPSGPDGIVDWASTTARQNNTNIAYYYPHGEASNIDGTNVVCAASGIALRTIAYSDQVSYLWFAPAGTRRGVVTGVTRVGYVQGELGGPTRFMQVNLNQGQRDDLYKYSTNINPIVFFPNRGLIVWGQKTSAPSPSALDRINVSRLVMYIKRQLRKNTMSFVFQPNDQLTRDNLKSVVDGFLSDLVVKRGLYDFATVCDETNNTPDRIDRNEMYIDVAIKPVKAAEFLYIPIRVVNTGAEI